MIGHGRPAVPLSTTRLPQHGLTLTLRGDPSGKWALETPDHATGYYGPHPPASKAKVGVGHNFPRYSAFQVQELIDSDFESDVCFVIFHNHTL